MLLLIYLIVFVNVIVFSKILLRDRFSSYIHLQPYDLRKQQIDEMRLHTIIYYCMVLQKINSKQ